MPDRRALDQESSTCDPRWALGRRGEDLAAEHLRGEGYAVIERNARTRHGEIDLIAFDGTALVFVEVKTRSLRDARAAPSADPQPLAGLGVAQRARLRRLAAAWLADRRRRRPFAETVRFDAIGVVLDADGRARVVEHVEDAW
jgi:putative endonuclease